MKSNKAKKIICSTALVLLNLAGAAILGMTLLYVAFSLPLPSIEKNVRLSATTIRNEGTYPKVTKYATSQLDNFTDSIMMLETTDISEVSRIEKTVFVYHGVIDVIFLTMQRPYLNSVLQLNLPTAWNTLESITY